MRARLRRAVVVLGLRLVPARRKQARGKSADDLAAEIADAAAAAALFAAERVERVLCECAKASVTSGPVHAASAVGGSRGAWGEDWFHPAVCVLNGLAAVCVGYYARLLGR